MKGFMKEIAREIEGEIVKEIVKETEELKGDEKGEKVGQKDTMSLTAREDDTNALKVSKEIQALLKEMQMKENARDTG